MRFLVVDDDRPTVSGLTRLLTWDEHSVAPFTSGAGAVDALGRQPFDVVITDLVMPEVDGYAVVRAAHERQPHACVVVVTARGDRARAMVESGVCVVAEKPIEYAALIHAIDAWRAAHPPA